MALRANRPGIEPCALNDNRTSLCDVPQPLSSKLAKHPHLQFFDCGGLLARPRLAVAFAKAVEEFAQCERAIGALVIALNRESPRPAFDALEGMVK